jgi:Multimeric flavodoxin WrbA
VFDDDMSMILASFDDARLFVLCTPVYTMTVPAGLKLLMDRCQSYHAKRMLNADHRTRNGLLLSVAGRKGMDNFSCMKSTVHAFMRNLGIIPSGDVLVDDMDAIRDIRILPGVRDSVRDVLDSVLES